VPAAQVYGPLKLAASPPHCPYNGAPVLDAAVELLVLLVVVEVDALVEEEVEEALVDEEVVEDFVDEEVDEDLVLVVRVVLEALVEVEEVAAAAPHVNAVGPGMV
jgi:hypothetical protein